MSLLFKRPSGVDPQKAVTQQSVGSLIKRAVDGSSSKFDQNILDQIIFAAQTEKGSRFIMNSLMNIIDHCADNDQIAYKSLKIIYICLMIGSNEFKKSCVQFLPEISTLSTFSFRKPTKVKHRNSFQRLSQHIYLYLTNRGELPSPNTLKLTKVVPIIRKNQQTIDSFSEDSSHDPADLNKNNNRNQQNSISQNDTIEDLIKLDDIEDTKENLSSNNDFVDDLIDLDWKIPEENTNQSQDLLTIDDAAIASIGIVNKIDISQEKINIDDLFLTKDIQKNSPSNMETFFTLNSNQEQISTRTSLSAEQNETNNQIIDIVFDNKQISKDIPPASLLPDQVLYDIRKQNENNDFYLTTRSEPFNQLTNTNFDFNNNKNNINLINNERHEQNLISSDSSHSESTAFFKLINNKFESDSFLFQQHSNNKCPSQIYDTNVFRENNNLISQQRSFSQDFSQDLPVPAKTNIASDEQNKYDFISSSSNDEVIDLIDRNNQRQVTDSSHLIDLLDNDKSDESFSSNSSTVFLNNLHSKRYCQNAQSRDVFIQENKEIPIFLTRNVQSSESVIKNKLYSSNNKMQQNIINENEKYIPDDSLPLLHDNNNDKLNQFEPIDGDNNFNSVHNSENDVNMHDYSESFEPIEYENSKDFCDLNCKNNSFELINTNIDNSFEPIPKADHSYFSNIDDSFELIVDKKQNDPIHYQNESDNYSFMKNNTSTQVVSNNQANSKIIRPKAQQIRSVDFIPTSHSPIDQIEPIKIVRSAVSTTSTSNEQSDHSDFQLLDDIEQLELIDHKNIDDSNLSSRLKLDRIHSISSIEQIDSLGESSRRNSFFDDSSSNTLEYINHNRKESEHIDFLNIDFDPKDIGHSNSTSVNPSIFEPIDDLDDFEPIGPGLLKKNHTNNDYQFEPISQGNSSDSEDKPEKQCSSSKLQADQFEPIYTQNEPEGSTDFELIFTSGHFINSVKSMSALPPFFNQNLNSKHGRTVSIDARSNLENISHENVANSHPDVFELIDNSKQKYPNNNDEVFEPINSINESIQNNNDILEIISNNEDELFEPIDRTNEHDNDEMFEPIDNTEENNNDNNGTLFESIDKADELNHDINNDEMFEPINNMDGQNPDNNNDEIFELIDNMDEQNSDNDAFFEPIDNPDEPNHDLNTYQMFEPIDITDHQSPHDDNDIFEPIVNDQ